MVRISVAAGFTRYSLPYARNLWAKAICRARNCERVRAIIADTFGLQGLSAKKAVNCVTKVAGTAVEQYAAMKIKGLCE
jgi:hypothetical protein